MRGARQAGLRAYVLVWKTGKEQDNLHRIKIIPGGDRCLRGKNRMNVRSREGLSEKVILELNPGEGVAEMKKRAFQARTEALRWKPAE